MRLKAKCCLAVAIALIAVVAVRGSRRTNPVYEWISSGVLLSARSGACAVALPDGRVLISGGEGSQGPLSTAEIYSVSGKTSAAPPMSSGRAGHVCVALADGRVLVAGGTAETGGPTNAAEIFDPRAQTWTPAGSMRDARAGATASLLPNGRVLVAGGQSFGRALATLEIYDPAVNAFRVAGALLSSPRSRHAASVLRDGRVLLSGGFDGERALDTVDVFDPAAETVSAAGALSVPRDALAAVTLLDGRVYFAGGRNGGGVLASAETWDPLTGEFSAAAPMTSARAGHAAVRIPHNNAVLLVGGAPEGQPSAAELYVPWTNSYRRLAGPGIGRTGASLVAPADGLVIAAGGANGPVRAQSVSAIAVPTISTDKADYQPGEQVTISGANWKPGETITFNISRSPTARSLTLTTTADSAGNFLYRPSELVMTPDDVGQTYTITATGNQGSTAQTITFTDGGNFGYSPGSQSLTISPGGSGSFSQSVTAPSGNGSFTASVQVAGTGTPIPGTWVTTTPLTLSFNTASGADTKSWTVNIAVPSGTAGGTYTANIKADASIGGVGAGPGTSLTVIVPGDTTPPDTSITANPANPTNQTAASFSFSGADNLTPAANLTFECQLDGGGFASCSSPKSYSGLSQGSHTFQVRAKDAANNVDPTPASFTWTIDTTKPTITASATANGSPYTGGVWTKYDVAVSFTCSDNAGGSGLATNTVAGATKTAEGAGQSVTNTGTCTDNAGNSADAVTFGNIQIDKTAPTISASATSNGNPYTSGAWTNANVVVTFTCSDQAGLSGLAAGSPPSPTTVTMEGITASVPGTCSDNAGNSANASFTDIRIDKTKPIITASATANGSPYTGGVWTKYDVAVSFTCSDNAGGSGLATNTVAGATKTTEGSGQSVTNTGTCTDNAGNSADAVTFGNIQIDKTAPTISASATSNSIAYTSGTWTNANVVVTFTCSDQAGLSGLAAGSPPSPTTVTTEGITASVPGTCSDNAGNSANASFTDIRIDKTKPIITASATANGSPYTGGVWTKYDVAVSFTCSDNAGGSGLATNTVAGATKTTEGAGQSVTNGGSCTDNAGNSANAVTFGNIQIDKTPPGAPSAAISPAPNLAGWNSSAPVTVVFSGVDALSGIAACTTPAPITTATAGTLVSGNCTDNAGNSGLATTVTVKVDLTAPDPASSVVATPSALGAAGTLTASLNDPSSVASGIESARFNVDGGPYQNMTAATGSSFGNASANVTATLPSFTTTGVHTVCVVASDVAGNTGPSSCAYYAVYDPSAGFVTGGGWITSPSGAYAANPSLTGKANFGFVSKYQKGANVPSGDTEFQFQAASFNFKSVSYEWLVISGSKAQYKGAGTVNGAPGYGFLLTAVDGSVSGGGGSDKFRLKVWNTATSAVVYDNQAGADDNATPATVLGGGSIVIHSAK